MHLPAVKSHCSITPNSTTVPNQSAWSENFHLLALNHPIGAGFSYGSIPNNSRSAAHDVYDFLQKFFSLYPTLAENRFVLSSGSYGGTYIPHIAIVIHEQNQAINRGRGQPGARHINLESIMISNPLSDSLSHWRWLLHHRCYNTQVYNSTTCGDLYSHLPGCLEGIQFAYENPTVENRVRALNICVPLEFGERNGTMLENVKKKCNGTIEDCIPETSWIYNFLNSTATRETIGVPENVPFKFHSSAVLEAFKASGDLIQPAYRLYEPLLRDGIKLLRTSRM